MEAHKWRNRVVIVFAEQPNQELFQRQIAELEKHSNGLEERKIVVYKVTPSTYQFEDENWTNSDQFFTGYFQRTVGFEVLLIGLDGGVKRRQAELLSAADLFSEIDQMPMRRAEIRHQKNE